jgi:hypothetical protein
MIAMAMIGPASAQNQSAQQGAGTSNPGGMMRMMGPGMMGYGGPGMMRWVAFMKREYHQGSPA